MSRHRSPNGRNAYLGPPLSALMAAAGAGGAHRSIPLNLLASSMPARFVATVVAGGALAAAGQHAVALAVPAATEGVDVLRVGVQDLLGDGDGDGDAAAAAPAALTALPLDAPLVAVAPVAPEPLVADAAALVKGAELQRAAARAAEAARVEAARAAAAKAEAAKADAARQASVVEGVRVVAGRLTSGFGARWGTSHQGVDIAAPIGTPIYAPLGGTVISSGAASGFGMWVRVQHADGAVSVYGHINRSLVRVGEKVRAGQEIAEVGNRGRSTGPHLHLGVMVDGRYVNPRPWLDGHSARY